MSMFTDICAGMKTGDAMANEIASLRHQLATVTAERDGLRAIVAFADARINNTLRVERRANPRSPK